MNNEIKIQPSKGNNKVEISNNFAQYFEQLAKKHADDAKESELLAKDWANKLGSTVDDTEYSSKYYALKSKEEHGGAVEDIATAKTELEQSIATGLEDYNTNAQAKSDSLQTQFDTSISDIKKQETTSINAVKTTQTTAESSIADKQANAETVISNGMADITANKEQSMSAIDGNRETSLAEIESAKSDAVSSVNTTKDNAVSTVKQTGTEEYNKILSTGIDSKLGENQITNCLLEVPQRIKYTLENGTLTIKAGSVVIVPYGTEDKTADLPIGATFINENFKVYDTQYTEDSDGNGKFFVWIELRKDLGIITEETISLTGFLIGLNDNGGHGFWSAGNFSSGSSFPSNPQFSDVFYHVTNNRVYFYSQTQWNTTDLAGNDCLILPQIKFTGVNKQIVSVDQVFNGMGCIGSTIWADKGVKGLIPNGRNADGSLINEEVVIDKLYTFTYNWGTNSSLVGYELSDGTDVIPKNHIIADVTSIVYEQSVMPTSTAWKWIDTANNQIWYKNENESLAILQKPYKVKNLYLGEMTTVNGKITSFTPKLPFRAADENDIDGRLKMVNNQLLNNYSLPIGQTIKVDLSSVLPNDGEIYECRFEYQTAAAYNQTAFIYQQSDLELKSAAMWRGRSFSNTASMQGGGTFIAYVGGQRYINLISTSASGGACNITLYFLGYRKVGK